MCGLLLALVAIQLPLGPEFPSETIVPVMVAMAFSVVGLLTIVFSLLFTVVQWVYSTFSMRLRRFESRPLTWWVFGLAIGIFVYSTVAAGLVLGQEMVSWVVPGITVMSALATLVLVRRVQMDAFLSVQLGRTLANLYEDCLAAIRANYPEASDDFSLDGSVAQPETATGSPVTWEGSPAVFQELDELALVSQLEHCRGTCHFEVGVGTFLVPGMVIAKVSGTPAPDIGTLIVAGHDRTPIQDPLFSLQLIVDIAVRALSPAVNDAATAVQAMDAIEPLLAELATRDLEVGRLHDRTGAVVATLPVPSWIGILSQVLDDLVVCAAPLPTTARRLHRLLVNLEQAASGSRQLSVARRRSRLLAMSAYAAESPG